MSVFSLYKHRGMDGRRVEGGEGVGREEERSSKRKKGGREGKEDKSCNSSYTGFSKDKEYFFWHEIKIIMYVTRRHKNKE